MLSFMHLSCFAKHSLFRGAFLAFSLTAFLPSCTLPLFIFNTRSIPEKDDAQTLSLRAGKRVIDTSPTLPASSILPNASTVLSRELYLITPKNPTDERNDGLTSQLHSTFGPALYVLGDELVGILYWRAPLNPAQVALYARHPLVDSVVQDQLIEEIEDATQDTAPPTSENNPRRKKSLKTRDGLFVTQDWADDLALYSNSTAQDTWQDDEYVYDSVAGAGVTIYCLDSGANPGSPEFSKTRGSRRWIWVDSRGRRYGERPWNEIDKYGDTNGHGTGVISKMVSPTYGVAKAADLVVVRFPERLQPHPTTGSTVSSTTGNVIEGLLKISEDIRVYRLFGKAVINISFGTTRRLPLGCEIILKILISYGAVIVIAAGNYGQERDQNGLLRKEIDLYPALYIKSLPSLITVGYVDKEGRTARSSQGLDPTLLSISAPGVEVGVDPVLSQHIRRKSGSSVAAGAVSGLAAYLMALRGYESRLKEGGVRRKGANVKALMQELAWPRVRGGRGVAYNGVFRGKSSSLPPFSLVSPLQNGTLSNLTASA